jgi:regulator of nonsense transcripts 1
MEKPSTNSGNSSSYDSHEEYSSSEEEVLFDGQDQYSESEGTQTPSRKESEQEEIRTVLEKCEYCGVNNADELVKCLDCGDWFCNTKLGRSASHAIFHLVKRKHKRISKHKESQFGELTFECFFCKNGNIFQLGLVPYMLENQKTFLICCRKFFCTTKSTISQFQVEEDQWRSLIIEKQLLDFLVTCSQKSIQLNEKLKLKVNYLTNFENQRMKGKELTLEEHQQTFRQEEQNEIEKIPLTWPDVESYCRDFLMLVEKEMEEDQRQKESVFFSDLSLNWKSAQKRKNKVLVVCKLPIYEEVDINSFTNQMVELALPMRGNTIMSLINSLQGTEPISPETVQRTNQTRIPRNKFDNNVQKGQEKRAIENNHSTNPRSRRKEKFLVHRRSSDKTIFI